MSIHEQTAMTALVNALNDRATTKSPVNFWLRDDDAVLPGESLERLLGLVNRFAIPLTLAVIPASTGNSLAQRLAKEDYVSVAVHGWSHTNYASIKEKKQELGNHRPSSVVLAELQQGFSTLKQLHPDRFIPLLVPPWNRISAELVSHLGSLGYKGLSTFGDIPADIDTSRANDADIAQVNTQVDIIDWKGNRGGRSVAELASEIITQLQENKPTVGILTHHLVHDEAAWQFLEQLFKATYEHPGAVWLSVADLL